MVSSTWESGSYAASLGGVVGKFDGDLAVLVVVRERGSIAARVDQRREISIWVVFVLDDRVRQPVATTETRVRALFELADLSVVDLVNGALAVAEASTVFDEIIATVVDGLAQIAERGAYGDPAIELVVGEGSGEHLRWNRSRRLIGSHEVSVFVQVCSVTLPAGSITRCRRPAPSNAC